VIKASIVRFLAVYAARNDSVCVLRHFGHALAVEPNFADAFDTRENVINRLAADAHQFRADDACYEIAGQIENLLRSRPLEAFAKNRRHRARQRLYFGAERHSNMCLSVFVHVQVNANRVRAVFVLSHINQVKLLVFARFLVLHTICVGNECLAPFILRQ